MSKALERLCMQDISGAIDWLRRATELEPNVSKYRTKLARLLAAVPQYRQEALEQYEKAMDAAYDRRGWDRDGVPTLARLKELGIDLPPIVSILRSRQ